MNPTPTIIPGFDFFQFWAATVQLSLGHNPYDNLLLQNVAVGTATYPIDYFLYFPYPPWVLALLLPLSWLSFQNAFLVWSLTNIFAYFLAGCIFASTAKVNSTFFSLLIVLSFSPALFPLILSQSSPLVILGLAVLLQPSLSRYHALGLSLLAWKPHLFLAVFAWFGWRAFFEPNKFRLVTYTLAILVLETLVVTAFSPSIVFDYCYQLANFPAELQKFAPPSLTLFIPENFHSEFFRVSLSILALAGGLFCAIKYSTNEGLLIALTISLFFRPYGWAHDSIFLLPLYAAFTSRLSKESYSKALLFCLAFFLVFLGNFNYLTAQSRISTLIPLAFIFVIVTINLRTGYRITDNQEN